MKRLLAALLTACAPDVAPLPHVEPPAEIVDGGFGDSGWYCCYTRACDVAGERICDPDEVPATDGLSTCCVLDVGQCK